MSFRDREGLMARVRHIRRVAEASKQTAKPERPGHEHEAIPALEARIKHLEQLLQGLQDSVHREATRQGKRLADLEARIEPEELRRSLSEDARERGLGP